MRARLEVNGERLVMRTRGVMFRDEAIVTAVCRRDHVIMGARLEVSGETLLVRASRVVVREQVIVGTRLEVDGEGLVMGTN